MSQRSTWTHLHGELLPGLEIIDQLDNSKFRSLIVYVCEAMHYDPEERIFNKDRVEQLLLSIGLTKKKLTVALNTIKDIYANAAYYVIKPSDLEANIKSIFKLSEDKLSILAQGWMAYGAGIIKNFKQRSIFPTQVVNWNWSLNVQSSSSVFPKDAQQTALIQLILSVTADMADVMRDANTTMTVEFNKSQLTALYDNMEKIQSQLDKLNL
ncbi:hypothetical protein P5V15_014445 [Pogonomyrmex californicus]